MNKESSSWDIIKEAAKKILKKQMEDQTTVAEKKAGERFRAKISGRGKEYDFEDKVADMQDRIAETRGKNTTPEAPTDKKPTKVEDKPSNLVQFPGTKPQKQEETDAEEEDGEDTEEKETEEAEQVPGPSDARNEAVKATICQMLGKVTRELSKKGGIGDDSPAFEELEDSLKVVLSQEVKIADTETKLAREKKRPGEAEASTKKRESLTDILSGKRGKEQKGLSAFQAIMAAGLGVHKSGESKGQPITFEDAVSDAEIAKSRLFLYKELRGQKKETDSAKKSANEKVLTGMLDGRSGVAWQEQHAKARKVVESLSAGIEKDPRMKGEESLGEVLAKNEDLREAFKGIKRAKENMKRIEANLKRQLTYEASKTKFKQQGKDLWSKAIWGPIKDDFKGGFSAIFSLDINKIPGVKAGPAGIASASGEIMKGLGKTAYFGGVAGSKKAWEKLRRNDTDTYEK